MHANHKKGRTGKYKGGLDKTKKKKGLTDMPDEIRESTSSFNKTT